MSARYARSRSANEFRQSCTASCLPLEHTPSLNFGALSLTIEGSLRTTECGNTRRVCLTRQLTHRDRTRLRKRLTEKSEFYCGPAFSPKKWGVEFWPHKFEGASRAARAGSRTTFQLPSARCFSPLRHLLIVVYCSDLLDARTTPRTLSVDPISMWPLFTNAGAEENDAAVNICHVDPSLVRWGY